MNNPVLLSEPFESAVSRFRQAVDAIPQLDATPLNNTVSDFQRQVDRLCRLAGMVAANQDRMHRGESLAYDEQAFVNI